MSGQSRSSTGRSVTELPRITRSVYELAVDRKHLGRRRVPREPKRRSRGFVAHPSRELAITDDLQEPIRVVGGIVPVDEEPGPPVFHDEPKATDRRGDDRGATGLRLQRS